MNIVTPDYYADFACLQGACRHNCCIGWEIDIDEDTLDFYRTVPDPFGDRLRRHIGEDETPHFVLGEHERCPFLNRDNLCDIILTLGEDALCDICNDHPRFRNYVSDRVEMGLGLACEAAGKLILGRHEPMRLSGDPSEDPVVQQRDRLLTLLQDRTRPLDERLRLLLTETGATPPHTDMAVWADTLLSLERLDEEWTRRLSALKAHLSPLDLTAFKREMATRETEYEQLAVYLLYRHFVNTEADTCATFVMLGVMLLWHLGAVQFAEHGAFTFDDQVELARLFSSEIEYSDENLAFFLER